jgi:anti-sigma factor RsiW
MTAMTNKHMTDMELNTLLAQVKQPELPAGFAERLQARLEQPAASNVIAFPARQQQRPSARRYWLSAIPLAASLVFGIYLGAAGSLPESLSGLESSLVSDATESLLGVGIEDTESFLNGDLS